MVQTWEDRGRGRAGSCVLVAGLWGEDLKMRTLEGK